MECLVQRAVEEGERGVITIQQILTFVQGVQKKGGIRKLGPKSKKFVSS